uniref:F-box/FBD/LRR-repeat protein At1g13570-like n=1 Tax=Erigeron canadensis TaxID=72917 RepID=UPI001CB9CFDA|nr:F-box/FBD/LRR-repeat protein At1g13570-like [Erigeron canadensis]
MEVVHHCCKASKVSPQGGDDFISSMPENVIANIMDRLPLTDAVGTSVLSPAWRFNWTLLTQLILDDDVVDSLPEDFNKSDISRLLLHLKQVTKFCLTITSNIKLDDADMYHWLMFLSRIRGFKELTLYNARPTPLKLPTHLFSCLDLKHLELCDCVLSPSPYFRGFPKLLTLELDDVSIPEHKYGEFIARCPLLETLKIWNRDLIGEVKLVEIAKLKNLKVVRLSSCLLDIHINMVRLSTVFHRMSLLPKLLDLNLSLKNCEFLLEDVAQTAFSSTFPFLKSLGLYHMDFSSVSMLSCAFAMIFGCPNLQALSIYAMYKNVIPLPTIFPSEVDCSTTGKLQLQKVTLVWIKGLENEVCLIKYILACSPKLKSIEIQLDSSIASNVNDKYKLANKLLKLHRTSPIAEVVIL